MIARATYYEQLREFIDKPQIKILTGIRRSGKSTALLLLKEELLARRIDGHLIIHINLESFVFSDLRTATQLYRYVEEKVQKGKRAYLLLDEIQEVDGWEKAINSMLVDFDVDIYLTGSNSHLLSSELATYLAGRFVEIPVYTLSFAEYLQFRTAYFPGDLTDRKSAFMAYLRVGGFPVLHTANYSIETAYKVVYDIYSSVILRDTVQRYKIRDVELLERIVKYAIDNIGNTFSGKNVADYFKSQQRKIDLNTVYNYLTALEGAFILYRASRYDIKGKEILKTQEKFYLSDVGLLYATMGYRDRMISGILENIVFLELKRRGYAVFVGKFLDKEIDFIAEKKGQKIYVQVAYKLESEQTVEREFSSLLAIQDQFPKYVVTLDDFWKEAVEGVQHVHLSDFLLQSF
ncbi:ATP-binding protein [Algoriphagus halophytocola]|uniref:ATP-binding protein n=1 Tax=Algoriphagus halophytocola TaxID=2991499 RepID=A0ABY6MDR6_9BACT|nr:MULTISPECIES: ATP-binding protein [unclassified Algoriphagus]UZD21044.1 ATP-binding protein [Algoriphagus sp. TR-M5]WBL42210.1 ATP-binding protein [Algoriphagus sp. TR-M9]